MLTAAISLSSTGTVVAADAQGRRIRVRSLVMSASASLTAQLQSSGGTDLSGAMPMIAGVPFVLPVAGKLAGGFEGYTQTLPGEGLKIVLSGSGNVGGMLTYELVP